MTSGSRDPRSHPSARFDGPSGCWQSPMTGEPAMDWSHLDLNPKVVAAVKQANIQSMKEILCLSGPDLQRLTKLSSSDVQYLHKTVAATIKSDPVVTALQVYNGECPFPTQNQKLSTGCPVVDSLLGGGIPLMGITEIVGESSAGKTQICLQLSLSVQFPCSYGGQNAGAVYICTEDTFPNKRLQQLIAFQSMLRTDVPPDIVNNINFGNNVFIEHVADVITDMVNDSNLPQGNFGLLGKKVLPALGVTWSNQLLMRLMVSRTQLCIEGKFPDEKACTLNSGTVLRRMEIIFAPHLPQSFCNYIICKEGVRGMGL
ncbi:DNA repair protein XRCC3 isoform X3 [Stegostoma tigrinum]|uniref:DNA repair protein XRCC3 isoform X3 n=1 Tax=Stegostoma tigrinum TaxID=3053191 RepID=UPI00202B00E1|nr:DNA repair protein XRCC3 isoform X3 [Stegostoma tigrinum]